MTDVVQLLRELPLPGDPVDRYDEVATRRRRGDRRRYTVLSTALATVLVVAGVSVVKLQDKAMATNIADVLSAELTTAHLIGTASGGGATSSYEGDVDFANQRYSLVIHGSGDAAVPGRLEIRGIGEETWVSSPGLTGGKRWIHSSSKLDGAGVGGLDPSSLLSTLKSSGASLTPLGSERIDGVQTTRYGVRVDSAKSEAFQSGKGEVFVDDHGVVRRLKEVTDGEINVLTFSRFGEPVNVVAPPNDQVEEQPAPGAALGGSQETCSSAASPAPSPIGLGVGVTGSYSCTITTSSQTSEQQQAARARICQELSKTMDAQLKRHPEQKAQLEAFRTQVCAP
jgi:hypothetical protein